MQGGPRRGRSPITGPTLPHAAQASQTSQYGETPRPQGGKNKEFLLASRAKSPATQASQTSPEGETPRPQGSKNKEFLLASRAQSHAAQAS